MPVSSFCNQRDPRRIKPMKSAEEWAKNVFGCMCQAEGAETDCAGSTALCHELVRALDKDGPG